MGLGKKNMARVKIYIKEMESIGFGNYMWVVSEESGVTSMFLAGMTGSIMVLQAEKRI